MKRVWVNGTFDILHIGHLELLKYASSFGSVIVGIDSDKRVKQLKGPLRPFNNQDTRSQFLSSLRYVNNVVIFDNDDQLEHYISEYKPHYFVIGDDYQNRNIIGSHFAEKLVFYNKIPDISTTKILNYGKTESL
jgi:D-beta-D-heptose 7-phosphate kinase/D-beta-D-heptose 1-phosphate adenosyltransferase